MKFETNLFKGRVNRRNFLIGQLISLFFSFLLVAFLILASIANSDIVLKVAILLFVLPDIALLIFSMSLLIRRLHDLGKSAWYLVLLFIPIVVWFFLLWLLLKKGQGNNKYGDKPSKNIKFPADIFNQNWTINSAKRKIMIIPLILFVLFLISGLFYLFLWKPGEIRKICRKEALSIEASGSLLKAMGVQPSKVSQNNKYRDCLVKNGMKPESLFVNLSSE